MSSKSPARTSGKGPVRNSSIRASSSNIGALISGSKKNHATAGGTAAGKASSSSIPQVIINGKNMTPQSLLYRKPAPPQANGIAGSTWLKKAKAETAVTTIDETASEVSESGGGKLKLKSAHFGTSDARIGVGRTATMASNPGAVTGRNKKVADETVTIMLSETETVDVISISAFVIPSDLREVTVVDEKNAHYEKVVEAHKVSDGGFMSRPTQTLNNPQKNQNEMAAPNALRDFGSQAMSYDIIDATAALNRNSVENELGIGISTSTGTGTDGDVEDAAGLAASVRKFVEETVALSRVMPGCMLDPADLTAPPVPGEARAKAEGGRNKRSNAGGTTTNVTSVLEKNSGLSAVGASMNMNNDDMVNASSANPNSDSNSRSQFDMDDAGGGSTGVGRRNSMVDMSEQETQQVIRDNEANTILSSKMLLKRLLMIERAVQQNAYHRQQLDYRDLPDVAPISFIRGRTALDQGDHGGGLGGLGSAFGRKNMMQPLGGTMQSTGSVGGGGPETGDGEHTDGEEAPKVKKLFCYYADELVQGRAVTAMAWNAVNSDLLAVGYGKLDTFVDNSKLGEPVDEQQQGGLVLFWSLRNPEYPERILRTAFPVSALDFSKLSPMMLAVGLNNGDVNVYDLKRDSDWGTPVQSSAGMANGHSDPVWQLKWVVKGADKIESLVSISTDGQVLEWNTKKGFVMSSLMQLKRGGMGEGWISRKAAGLCFDFVPNDQTTYVTGTEEGSLHRCSVSYNEQYLDTYIGHQGPVHRVKFSPRWPNLFLSCSADWTIRLYHLRAKAPLLAMSATGEDFAVSDIAWCPDNSTVFAAVTAHGKLQLWDLSVSSLDPVVTVDTNVDDIAEQIKSARLKMESRESMGTSPPASPPAQAAPTRFGRGFRDEERERANNPVASLIKNLSQSSEKRVLTCVQFGEKSPTIVVGDNRGAVTLYRVLEPVTITHEGPMQQAAKLKAAVTRQADPSSARMLAAAEEELAEDSGNGSGANVNASSASVASKGSKASRNIDVEADTASVGSQSGIHTNQPLSPTGGDASSPGGSAFNPGDDDASTFGVQ